MSIYISILNYLKNISTLCEKNYYGNVKFYVFLSVAYSRFISFSFCFSYIKSRYFFRQYILVMGASPSTLPSNAPHSLPSGPPLFCLSLEKNGLLKDNNKTRYNKSKPKKNQNTTKQTNRRKKSPQKKAQAIDTDSGPFIIYTGIP